MRTSFSFIVLLLLLILNARAQQTARQYSVLFYNVENLFDVKNDSLTDDDEFTFDGERHWNRKRLNQKLQNLSKVILSCSGWNTPALVGMCEIENCYVLEQLLKVTPIKCVPYKIIHKESPDFRGIDVALLYNQEQFYPIKYEYYPLIRKNGETMRSREILYVSGILDGIDTLHVFVNHWPSRYSGVMETRELRNSAARLVRSKIDQLLEKNIESKIIVVGDFNDQPEDESVARYLGAKKVEPKISHNNLYNLSSEWDGFENGTLKYKSQWFIYDQIIVSGALLNIKHGLKVSLEHTKICDLPFLLEEDEKYGGNKPKRTYYGYEYNGGFSDHLPVSLQLEQY